jgi:hypothetical protein
LSSASATSAWNAAPDVAEFIGAGAVSKSSILTLLASWMRGGFPSQS